MFIPCPLASMSVCVRACVRVSVCPCVCVNTVRCFIWSPGLARLRCLVVCVYRNIIPTVHSWQKFCLNPLCAGFSARCVKLKPCSPLFMCSEWITCSHSCLHLRLWVLQYQLAQCEFYPAVLLVHVTPFGVWISIVNQAMLQEVEGARWIFTLMERATTSSIFSFALSLLAL